MAQGGRQFIPGIIWFCNSSEQLPNISVSGLSVIYISIWNNIGIKAKMKAAWLRTVHGVPWSSEDVCCCIGTKLKKHFSFCSKTGALCLPEAYVINIYNRANRRCHRANFEHTLISIFGMFSSFQQHSEKDKDSAGTQRCGTEKLLSRSNQQRFFSFFLQRQVW